MRLERGTEIGRYTIGERIGIGSASIVYKAQNRDDGTAVAFKLLSRARLFNAWARAAFRQEVEALTALGQAQIVPIYQFGQYRQQVYLTMPFMEGGSLKRRISQGSMPLEEVCTLCNVIASALDAAHAADIIHSNLKPTNLLFDESGEPHLSDFGSSQQSGANSGLLRGNALLQTTYASPEQIRDERLSPRSDVYSLTALLFHMLIGMPPFVGERPSEVVQAHLALPVPAFDNELDQLFQKGMAKHSAERPATISDLIKLIPDTISAPKKRRWWQPKR